MRCTAVRLAVFVCAVVCVSGLSQIHQNFATSQIEHDGDRQKRQISMMEKVAISTLKKLLKDAEPIRHSGSQRSYRKSGDWGKAQTDFYALKPSEIRRPDRELYKSQGEVVFGRKGDRRIRLIEKDSRKGVPTIEVIKNDTKSGPYIDKIFYEKKKKSRK